MERLNAMDSGYTYRLPTGAEREYAARAGTTTRFYWGDDPNHTQIGNYAWYDGTSDGSTHPVFSKLPIARGLHDMIGNVWEWFEDTTPAIRQLPHRRHRLTGSGSSRVRCCGACLTTPASAGQPPASTTGPVTG